MCDDKAVQKGGTPQSRGGRVRRRIGGKPQCKEGAGGAHQCRVYAEVQRIRSNVPHAPPLFPYTLHFWYSGHLWYRHIMPCTVYQITTLAATNLNEILSDVVSFALVPLYSYSRKFLRFHFVSPKQYLVYHQTHSYKIAEPIKFHANMLLKSRTKSSGVDVRKCVKIQIYII